MSARQDELLEQYRDNLLGVFGDPSLVLVSGEGVHVTDANGKRYMDLLAGIAVNALGHAHPAWVRAVSEQAGSLAHISNLFTSPGSIALAHKLLDVTGAPEGSHVFFANSGSEANEAAFKLARRHGAAHPDSQGRPRQRVIALEHSFHGRTMGALALTAKEAYRAPFEPLPAGVEHVPATVEALEAALDDTVSAVIVEPVQGEAGVLGLPEGFLARARELTREHGALLVVDEVQSGIGRTGAWLASSAQLPAGEFPDAVTFAKGLGGGFPVGALLTAGPEVSGLLSAGQHGTTFGGNPLAMAAGLATLTVIEDEDLLANARRVGEHLAQGLRAVGGVAGVRQYGLLLGVDLVQEGPEDPVAQRVVAAARDAGFILNATGPATLRLAPPLIITERDVDEFVAALPRLLAAREH
ncbi:acetylornithine transaminase [Glutamicibacter protophormiae]|uniref:acetylornithine transaminase n=3 Tax=Micrococcaceae TaxID=1268 RepID=UPI0006D7BDC9|nr:MULTISPECIES: acetylornithine transaminase [Kocuria]RUP82901.1 acetylornithine transaminase [Kocuria sp. HSID17590]WNB89995.1 acetylornithine transaminase [Glutamicibacter protophormiae]